MTVKRDEEFAEMFAQCWRALSDNFYDPQHHGANWNAVRARSSCTARHAHFHRDPRRIDRLRGSSTMMLG